MSSSARVDPGSTAGQPDHLTGQPPLTLGASVQLSQRPPYLKTADPMPMLRPPDLIDDGECGTVVELRNQDQRAVRFRRGTFLLALSQLRSAPSGDDSQPH